jgi:hypothetical protein
VTPPRDAGGHLWPTAEQLLLLHAAVDEGDAAIAAFLEWASRIDLSQEFSRGSFRLLPLAFHNVQRLGLAHPLLPRLRGVYRKAWVETHQLLHRTRPEVEALVEAGIDVLLLKGAPLVLSYYGNHALRPMSDLDVAVPHERARDALTLLRAMGWRGRYMASPDALRFRHAVQLFHPDGTELDLHHRVLFEGMRDDADRRLWSATEPLDFSGVGVRQLDPAAMLLHTVVHGVRANRETPVRWIPDALVILRRRGGDIEVARLVAMARAIHVTARLRMGLELLAAEFGAPLPAGLLSTLGAVAPSLLERMENTVALTHPAELEGAIANQWSIFVDYCRCPDAARARSFLPGFSHYVRYRLDLHSRRQILPRALTGLRRRLRSDTLPLAGSR